MGQMEMSRRKSAGQRMEVRPLVPEGLAVVVANIGLIAHAWKEDFDLSDIYEALLMEHPKVAEWLKEHENMAAEREFCAPDPSYVRQQAYRAGNTMVLSLPIKLVDAIIDLGMSGGSIAGDVPFSSMFVELLVENPRVQAAISERNSAIAKLRTIPTD